MKVQTIMNIELSSVCNYKCVYCPAKDQKNYRPTGFMTEEIFKEVVKWIIFFSRQGTQTEVNFFGVGEPTLHPSLLSLLAIARDRIPAGIPFHMNTNGSTMNEKLARNLYALGVQEIDVTAHELYATAKTVRIFNDVGIRYNISFDPVTRPNNWAGQVDWFEPRYPKPFPCPWIGNGQVMVMSNGDITRCCLDAFAKGVLGNTSMEVNEMEVTPFELCKTCHHTL